MEMLKAVVGLRPIFFGPGTLWRTWGTRPIPSRLTLPSETFVLLAVAFHPQLELELPASLHGAGHGDLVRILDVAAGRHSGGDPGHAHRRRA
jgi:hypothetical protein